MADSHLLSRNGLMFILSSPSGAGKTTIARRLLAEESNLAMSISVTTRAMRPGEVEGRDYFFKSKEAFDALVAEDGFIEYAEVFGNMYGTPRAAIADSLSAGRDVLFDVDWQGAQQLSQRAGNDVVSVFLLPPSIAELEARLRSRGTDDAAVIEGRMARARDEISHWDAYDYVLINDNLDVTEERLKTIVLSERLRSSQQPGLVEHVRHLQTEFEGQA